MVQKYWDMTGKIPVFNRAGPISVLRFGHCAQTVGPRCKIFSSEEPPYWVVLRPLSNQNSTENVYWPVSKFSHSYTLNIVHTYLLFVLLKATNMSQENNKHAFIFIWYLRVCRSLVWKCCQARLPHNKVIL